MERIWSFIILRILSERDPTVTVAIGPTVAAAADSDPAGSVSLRTPILRG